MLVRLLELFGIRFHEPRTLFMESVELFLESFFSNHGRGYSAPQIRIPSPPPPIPRRRTANKTCDNLVTRTKGGDCAGREKVVCAQLRELISSRQDPVYCWFVRS